MDFIMGLHSSGHYNSILVVIDKLSKYMHFIPMHHPFTTQVVADAFLNTVYKLHGLPLSVVPDRDHIFTSLLWKELFQHTQGTQLRMSSARHAQFDGKTKRVNQQVECYLRCFVSSHPSRWSKWLSLCEYWNNANWHPIGASLHLALSMVITLVTSALLLTIVLLLPILPSGLSRGKLSWTQYINTCCALNSA